MSPGSQQEAETGGTIGECVLCGHDFDAHEWWREVPMKYVPCPSCPDRLCHDPARGEAVDD